MPETDGPMGLTLADGAELTVVRAQAGGQGDFLSTLPMLIFIVAIFYFLVIRPQNKAREDHAKMLAALKKGDEVVTDGGIIGVVQEVHAARVLLRIAAPEVNVWFLTESVKAVLPKQEAS